MFALPLVFLTDALLGSVTGKVAILATLAATPSLLRRKEELREDAELGYNRAQTVLAVTEQYRLLGQQLTEKDVSALLASGGSGAEVRSFTIDREALPPELHEYAVEYVLTPSERVELMQFLLLEQVRRNVGIGPVLRRAGVGPQTLVMPDDNLMHLRARINMLRDHYTPLRKKDPLVMVTSG